MEEQELKAKAYDCLVEIEKKQAELRQINQQLKIIEQKEDNKEE